MAGRMPAIRKCAAMDAAATIYCSPDRLAHLISIPAPGLGDDDVAQIDGLTGLDGELLADRGVTTAEGWCEILDAIGCARDQGGERESALGVGLEVAGVVDRVE